LAALYGYAQRLYRCRQFSYANATVRRSMLVTFVDILFVLRGCYRNHTARLNAGNVRPVWLRGLGAAALVSPLMAMYHGRTVPVLFPAELKVRNR
jgi:hypothetical protein